MFGPDDGLVRVMATNGEIQDEFLDSTVEINTEIHATCIVWDSRTGYITH